MERSGTASGALDDSATGGDLSTRLAWQRTQLAEERTHLAWVRTAASTVVLGLAVAKLAPSSGTGAGAAALIVVTGLALLGYSTYRYSLRTPSRRWSGPAVVTGALGLTLLTASVLLACSATGSPLPHAHEAAAHFSRGT
jgi:uncharacterized membrane protein YidH (DUF202 family)